MIPLGQFRELTKDLPEDTLIYGYRDYQGYEYIKVGHHNISISTHDHNDIMMDKTLREQITR